jgi:peptidyl-prolyl cis-trans isomerase D
MGGTLPIAELKGVTETGEGTPLQGMPDIAKKIMSLSKSEISQLLDSGDSKFIFEMTDKYESYIPKLEDIKEQVVKDFKAVKSIEAASAKAETDAKLETVAAISKEAKKSFTTTPAFVRTEPINGLGMNQELMDAIFAAKPGTVLKTPYTIGRKVYLVQVDSLTKPSKDKLAEQKDQIMSALIGTKSDTALKDYVGALRKAAKIEISPRYQQYL